MEGVQGMDYSKYPKELQEQLVDPEKRRVNNIRTRILTVMALDNPKDVSYDFNQMLILLYENFDRIYTRSAISGACNSLKSEGHLKHLSHGVYALTPSGRKNAMPEDALPRGKKARKQSN